MRDSEEYIIVEGKNDILALTKLGIDESRMIYLGEAAYKIAEELSEKVKKVIILTDLDKEGKKLYASLKENLTRVGVQVDTYFREGLFKYSELSHIEGAYTYFRNLGLVE